MRVELINTGTELLLGKVINTHLKTIAEALFPVGLRIARQETVPDGEAIREALAASFTRADLVLVTGGLGPTTDDITREAVAGLLGVEMIHDAEVMAAIEARFARRGLPLSDRVGLQALRPAAARVLPNLHGTAPGLYLPSGVAPGSPHLFLLPGPPRELRPMLEASVIPIIASLASGLARPEMRTYRVASLGESQVEELVGADLLALDLELGYCARPGAVDLRIIGDPAVLDRAEVLVEEKLGAHIFARGDRSLEQTVVEALAASRQTLAIAESCTGGNIAHRITNVPGASEVFLAGYVTYANSAKTKALGVPTELLEAHGAVSAPVAAAMAEGALLTSGADWAISTTGIAGPGGGSAAKPVGTVFIALAKRGWPTQVEQRLFRSDRETFKQLVTQTALDLLRSKATQGARS